MSRFAASKAYALLVETLVAKRGAAKLTQLEVAQRLGKPQSFISKIERSERRIDVLEFCAVVRALGLAPAEVLAEVDRKLPASLAAEI